MRCARFQDWIQKKLDGELGARQLGLLEEHLRTCGRCRAALADYEWLARSLEEPAPAPCESLAPSVLERLAAERSRPARFSLRFAGAVAAAVAFAFALLFLARRAEPPIKPTIAREEVAPEALQGVGDAFLADLMRIESPSVLDDSALIVAENLETLKKDAHTAGKTILDVFDEIQRQLPLI